MSDVPVVDVVALTELAQHVTDWLGTEPTTGGSDGPHEYRSEEEIAADNACISLALAVPGLLQDNDDLREQIEDRSQKTFPATWGGFRAFIDEWYPADIFPASDKGLGPEFVVAARTFDDLREDNQRLTDENAAVRAERDEAVTSLAHARAEVAAYQTLKSGWLGERDVAKEDVERLRAELRDARQQIAAIRRTVDYFQSQGHGTAPLAELAAALGVAVAPPARFACGHADHHYQVTYGWQGLTDTGSWVSCNPHKLPAAPVAPPEPSCDNCGHLEPVHIEYLAEHGSMDGSVCEGFVSAAPVAPAEQQERCQGLSASYAQCCLDAGHQGPCSSRGGRRRGPVLTPEPQQEGSDGD